MPTVRVTWIIEGFSHRNPPRIYPIIQASPASASRYQFEYQQNLFMAVQVGTENGFPLYERKQPDGPELPDYRFNPPDPYFRMYSDSAGADLPPVSDVSFEPTNLPVYNPVNDSDLLIAIDGTISYSGDNARVYIQAKNAGPNNTSGFNLELIWNAVAPALGGRLEFVSRTGNTYTFRASSGAGNYHPPHAGYSCDLFLTDGQGTQRITGSPSTSQVAGNAMTYGDITRTYTGSGGPMSYYFEDSYGRKTTPQRVYLQAIPHLELAKNDDVLTVDASRSFAPVSTITGYQWSLPVLAALNPDGSVNASGILSPHATSTPRARLSLPESTQVQEAMLTILSAGQFPPEQGYMAPYVASRSIFPAPPPGPQVRPC